MKKPIKTHENASREAQCLDEYTIVERAQANRYSFTNIDNNISAKQGFGRHDYEYFRPGETTPKNRKDLLTACQNAYENNGIVHNVINLMADFGCQGIKLVHESKRAEKVYREWANHVKMKERSERFLNLLYRIGIVPVQRSTAKLNKKQLDRVLYAVSAADIEVQPEPEVEKNELPWKYTFLNPLSIEAIGGDLGSFMDNQKYGLRISESTKRKVLNPSDEDAKIIAEFPKHIINAIRSGKTIIPLDTNKVFFYHYKKDDWDSFGKPMVAPILKDLIMLDKLKLTDIAACDSAISTVRLWTIGDLEHKILPTPAAISKLASILTNNTGGGSFDLIWGPELTFKESESKIHQFLGSSKYEPTLNAIFAGLGIPPTMTGTATTGGFTNNFISLKTLIETLEYGRSILKMFWEQEIKVVQKALGLKKPAQIHFDRMTLSDESSEKRLLLDLLDRDLVSADTVLERFNEIPDIERNAINNDYTLRTKDKMPEKAGPYHNADALDEFKKLFIQQGTVTPSQVGVELEENKEGEVAHFDQQAELQKKLVKMKPAPAPGVPGKKPVQTKKKKGVSGQGRPKSTKDKTKRKQKVVKPRSKASLYNFYNWASSAQKAISEIVTPGLIKHYGKNSARELNNKEMNNIEEIKFDILLKTPSFSTITVESVNASLVDTTKNTSIGTKVYNSLNKKFLEKYQRPPTLEESRGLQAYTYSLIGDNDGES